MQGFQFLHYRKPTTYARLWILNACIVTRKKSESITTVTALSNMLLKLNVSPRSPAVVWADMLCDHLYDILEELPKELPTYDQDELLTNLRFLFQSPLFLYAIKPRLERAKVSLKSSPTLLMTPESMSNGDTERVYNSPIGIANLHILIKWTNGEWVTQLLYSTEALIEGRQCNTTQLAGFIQSFHWFCEEAKFLSCEYRAREHAAAVRLGTAVDVKPLEVREVRAECVDQSGRASGEKKQRRIFKLKIRFAIMHGRPVRVARSRLRQG